MIWKLSDPICDKNPKQKIWERSYYIPKGWKMRVNVWVDYCTSCGMNYEDRLHGCKHCQYWSWIVPVFCALSSLINKPFVVVVTIYKGQKEVITKFCNQCTVIKWPPPPQNHPTSQFSTWLFAVYTISPYRPAAI